MFTEPSQRAGITVFQKTQSSLPWSRANRGRPRTKPELKNKLKRIKCKTRRKQGSKEKDERKTEKEFQGERELGYKRSICVCYSGVGTPGRSLRTGSGPALSIRPLHPTAP